MRHNAYKQTYPHTPQYIMWDMRPPYPLTNESPWGGFSCPYNAMTQWDMILSHNGEWVEKFTHDPLGFTPQWEYNMCGRKHNHNGIIPQCGKPHHTP